MDLKATLQPSMRFAVWLLLLHVAASVIMYRLPLSLPVKLMAMLLIFLSLIYYLLRDALLFFPDSWCEIALIQNNISVVDRRGSGFLGQVENKTIVSPHVIVLWVRPEGRRIPVARVLFPDAMSAETFRDFCVRLKFV